MKIDAKRWNPGPHPEEEWTDTDRCAECGHFEPHWRHHDKKAKRYHPYERVPAENVGRPLAVPARTASGEQRDETPGANEASTARLPPASNAGAP